MVTAQDIKSGYGQKKHKPSTSVLPYLRAQQAEKKAAGNKYIPPKNEKTDAEKTVDKKSEAELDQYDKARQEILRECGEACI